MDGLLAFQTRGDMFFKITRDFRKGIKVDVVIRIPTIISLLSLSPFSFIIAFTLFSLFVKIIVTLFLRVIFQLTVFFPLV